MLENWHRHGVICGVVTDGPNPALVQVRERRYRAIPAPIRALNPIGSGDAARRPGRFRLEGTETEPMIRHAMGFAAANAVVWDAGAIEPEQAERFAQR